MSELTFQEKAVLWGQAYEVLVKRGVLACLVEHKLIDMTRPGLAAWRHAKLLDVSVRLRRELGILDSTASEVINSAVQHLALTAFGAGYTATRAYLDSVFGRFRNRDDLKVRAIWCPLTLPGDSTLEESVREESRGAFASEFGLEGIVDPSWSGKGQPANSDFTLWLSSDGKKEDFLLVQEYSYSMPSKVEDFREQGAHLEELLRHRRIVDSRSVFARISAEVDAEEFKLAPDIKNFLAALTSQDKPLYKLCQASSYVIGTVNVIRERGALSKCCIGRALAITPNGLESLAARFDPVTASEPRLQLMHEMGRVYRDTAKASDGDENALEAQLTAVFKSVLNGLPATLRKGMRGLRDAPTPGQDYSFTFDEAVSDFANPTDLFALEDAIGLVDDSPALNEYFGGSARRAIGNSMHSMSRDGRGLSLRDMHAAAVVAGLECAKAGQLTVLGLEGNPGIGKTTAIRRHLGNGEEGFFFLYVSPRVVINRDVTQSLARDESGEPTGILTLTTNAMLIAAAEKWHQRQVDEGLDTKRHIDCAVVADGVAALNKPNASSLLVLGPSEEETVTAELAGFKLAKNKLSEHEDLVKDRPLMGVLNGMALTAKELLALNPTVNRLVLTAALQGFRERTKQKTTIEALSRLFENKADSKAGRAERQAFATS